MKKSFFYYPFIFFLILFSDGCSFRQTEDQKKEIIQSALQWGGLYSIPVSIDSVNVKSNGGMFTREFLIEFSCKNDDIKKWVTECKRLKNNTPVIIRYNVIKYNIYPGEEGSEGGYVMIDYNTSIVTIDISWS